MLRWSLSTRRTLGAITRAPWPVSESLIRPKSTSSKGTAAEQGTSGTSALSLQVGTCSTGSAAACDKPSDNSAEVTLGIVSPHELKATADASEPEAEQCKPVPASLKAVDKLRFFLSDTNATSLTPAIPTASRLRRLYMFCRIDPNLLSAKERSALISLYGTLSLPAEMAALLKNPHPLAAGMREQSQRPWWPFVWLLLQDQRASGGLALEDLAWHFAAIRATNGNTKYSIVPSSFLSLAAALPESPTLDAAYDYQHIYTRSTSPLRQSDRIDHTELIRFFGTLALPTGVHTPHAHPAAEKIRGERQFGWTFVITLLRDKRRVKDLGAEDMYWLVVARSRMLGIDVEDIDIDMSWSLRDARSQHTGALLKELHTPGLGLASYIEGLLSLESEGASNEAIAWLCGLARRRVVLEASIQRVLWRAILRDDALSEGNQERLLRLVHSRIFEVKLTQALPAPAAESDDDDGVDTSLHKPSPLQAQDFLLRVSRHIFPTDSALDGQSPSQIVVKNWTRYLAQTMFDPKFSASARWMNLIHLAYANTPTADVSQAVSHIRLPGQDGGSLHPVDLRAIVLLTVFERLASRGQLQAQMGPIVERLWHLWAMSVREHITVHSTLVRPLLASFFMLAGHLHDPVLLSRMLDLSIDKSWIWAFDFGDDPAREQVRALVSAYIAASALCGQVVWEEIIAGVPSYAAFPQWVPSLLGAALARVAYVEPERAAELHVRWASHVAMPRQTLAPMVLALANAGRSDLALPLLPECDFRHADALSAFGAVLYSLSRGHKALDANAIEALSVALKAAVETTTIPSYMRGRFAWLLFQLVRAGQPYVDIAMQATAAMQKKNPRFFERNQVGGLVRTLLRRRYFKHAMALLERVNEHHSRRAVSAWARTAVAAFVRTAHRDFVPVANSSTPSTKLVARAKALITHPEIKRDLYASVLANSLNLRRRWRPALVSSSRQHEHRADWSPAFARAVRVILTMRGEKKLMNLLRRLGSRLSVWERTAVGNILLRYWVNKRDRRMRNDGNISATLETLKTALGFIPDRITVNILVGRALRRSTCPTRALFNELVRHGYPAPNGPPFDIPWRGPPVLVLAMLDGMKNKTSFTKHIRPLYKTFIRALARKGDLEGMRVVIKALKYAQEQHGVQLREQRIGRAQRRVGSKLDGVGG